ncbi:MAG: hypothetical protein AVO35_09625 [Candidatus Aegiribacteria sp. MLS_C]|nr:MAG: hypothetical protein AVO35_09625 [Candidatus Aegiribacteria sp. MLS_C]
MLHPECARIFAQKDGDSSRAIQFYQHQVDAIRTAAKGENYVLTTGTGSGKSLAYIVPIVDYALRHRAEPGIKAVIVYPLNALANSQMGELDKFINTGYRDNKGPVTFARYTGQESLDEKNGIIASPPDILLTNYVMLELILTRPHENKLIEKANGLRFMVLDELHTYRGRQGADVALLVRRAKEYFNAPNLQLIGTSATMSSGSDDLEKQKEKVAQVSSQLFGSTVLPENVIGETLERVTEKADISSTEFVEKLKNRIQSNDEFSSNFEVFRKDPVAIWLEHTIGLQEASNGTLVRAKPKPVTGENGISKLLASLTELPEDACAALIRKALLAGYRASTDRVLGRPPFAFRVHQFISPSETVYGTLEPEGERQLSLSGQYWSPDSAEKVMYPLVFCRKCGQEFYSVRAWFRGDDKETRFEPRKQGDTISEAEENVPGYLYLDSEHPWPDTLAGIENHPCLPADWLEEEKGIYKIRKSRRKWLPGNYNIRTDGVESSDGLRMAFIPSPFRFCPNCGVSYNPSQRSDYSKLASLGSEGRSTAITILSLFTVRELHKDTELEPQARKLLSFTDNRQDASLQAGHFNDFIEIGHLRGALYEAVRTAGNDGLDYNNLTEAVYSALGLKLEDYAADKDVKYQARDETLLAFKKVLGYMLYRDLRRGWRVNFPNLEQCGLLEIKYKDLMRICEDPEMWQNAHPVLTCSSPQNRFEVCSTLLDFMRSELAIHVHSLDKNEQEKIRRQSYHFLSGGWALDEDEQMDYASILFPRTRRNQYESTRNIFLSSRGAYGQYLRRNSTFPDCQDKLSREDTDTVIKDLLESLRRGGLLTRLDRVKGSGDVPGYQLNASCMVWQKGDGSKAFHDVIRVPVESEKGSEPNAFFKHYYTTIALYTKDYEAREHTAQVRSDVREEREEQFRNGELPILFCSPTMELGVDIAQLNVVSLRNVPPNPANYAQRSGRAGRGGEPALVVAYCGKGSPHDQYFFRNQEKMVAGSVIPPQIDLANEELIRSHVHAVWLKETGVHLGDTLKNLLDLTGEEPSMEILPEIDERFSNPGVKDRALKRCRRILSDILPGLEDVYWYSDGWLQSEMSKVKERFADATERWKDLYRSSLDQFNLQTRIMTDHSRPSADKKRAERLQREAYRQLELLISESGRFNSDFYPYRYFASEGFLPGYNFPRLPLSAYVPGRRGNIEGDYVQRPRFLAISEFGPRSIIYHEGSKYVIDKVIFALDGDKLATATAKRCSACGYMHPVTSESDPDICEYCGENLTMPLTNLFRLKNVSTRRRERISADEEERVRFGFDICTSIRFESREGKVTYRTAVIKNDNEQIAGITYGKAARIWRINLGWRRRKHDWETGFVLDVEKGTWARRQSETADDEDPSDTQKERVIPYVEDNKNSMIFKPSKGMAPEQMHSLAAALKNAIQIVFQLEDSELAAEVLPDREAPNAVLFYESSEGGAGVLTRLFEERESLRTIVTEALSLCHFIPETGEDIEGPEEGKNKCSKACYQCLLSYYNQSVHDRLDRHSIKDFLLELANSEIEISPATDPREVHLQKLKNLCDSELEKEWLDFLNTNSLQLPSHAQKHIEQCSTTPDFIYKDELTAIYIDGPSHDNETARKKDRETDECLRNAGMTVIRFSYRKEEWESIAGKFPSVFGQVE